MFKRFVLFSSIIVFLTGCGTVSTVRTLPPGERALALSLGGPAATLPGIADVPLPYSVLRYRWGIVDNLEAHIGIHPTMLIFGTFGMDLGLSYEFLEQNRGVPSLCAGLNPTMWLNPFNQDGVGAAPSADLVASWYVHQKILVYTGGQAFFQLQEPYIPWAALVGSEFQIGNHLGLGLEIKWYAPLEDSEFRVVNFPISPGHQGAFGILLGVSLYPGGDDD
ncbi:hypothetical protein JXM67_01900 [candidate division WOR-3 bacterium]|nr:hypothetical protein [candidate division WOR-3 bacterium]